MLAAKHVNLRSFACGAAVEYGQKILVVDDDELLLGALDCFLTQEDFRIYTVAKAEQIENAIADFTPDLIVMDIRLDTAGGRAVCNRLNLTGAPLIFPSY